MLQGSKYKIVSKETKYDVFGLLMLEEGVSYKVHGST
jgi:hypothetical protein